MIVEARTKRHLLAKNVVVVVADVHAYFEHIDDTFATESCQKAFEVHIACSCCW